jgi:pyruvate dehydrogenase E1 component alpha subunit
MSISYDIDDLCTASPAPPDRSEPFRILEPDGSVRQGAEAPDLDPETLLAMYRDLKLARRFDERAVSLQRQGRIPNYAPMTGQEGAQVGSAYAMADDDWLFPTYREHAAAYVRGVDLASLLLVMAGHREGYDYPEDANVLPAYVPIATQVPQAMGLAWGKQLQGDDDVVALCHFGDGATSEGDFHEGLNFAGVFDVPAVFFCNNNQWAISVPRERQSASATLAQKAHAYGFEGVLVDGMDPLAVYKVTHEALEKAKNPDSVADNPHGRAKRPTMIEAIQYRFGAHTTADDPSVYREEDEVERWKRKDPIPRLEGFLRERGVLDDEAVDTIQQSVEDEVAEAISEAETIERPDPSSMFENVYEEPTDRLEAQHEHLEALRERYGDEELLE